MFFMPNVCLSEAMFSGNFIAKQTRHVAHVELYANYGIQYKCRLYLLTSLMSICFVI